MVLITSNAAMNNILGVCDDYSTALDYIKAITKKPLIARRMDKHGDSYFCYEDSSNFKIVRHDPSQWTFVKGSESYYVRPVDYIL